MHKKFHALSDHFSSQSMFFTVTLHDDCNFCVQMYANQGNEIILPAADCTDSECVQDFDLRCRKAFHTLEHVLLIIKLLCKLCVNYQDGSTRRIVAKGLECLESVKHPSI